MPNTKTAEWVMEFLISIDFQPELVEGGFYVQNCTGFDNTSASTAQPVSISNCTTTP